MQGGFMAKPSASIYRDGASAPVKQKRRRTRTAFFEFTMNELAVQRVLQCLCRLESNFLGRCDFDRCARSRVTAFASSARLDLELAKAWQRNFIAGYDGISDTLKNAINNRLGLNFCKTLISDELFNEIGRIHFGGFLSIFVDRRRLYGTRFPRCHQWERPKSGFIPSVYRVFFKTGCEIQDYALKRLANRAK